MTVDTARLEQLTGQFAVDFGAALHAATVVLGDRLGLYRALAEHGPVDGAGLAAATGCDPRLVEEWCRAQYVSGYCCGDPEAGTYWLDPEQTILLADDSDPGCLVGAMTIAAALWKDEEEVGRRFRSGTGFGWHEHHPDLFDGTERLFRPGYAANLVTSWIPALDGVDRVLTDGADVADVGCGHGASTILLAQAYPRSMVIGYDYHEASIAQARKRAAEAGLADRVRFEVAGAADLPAAPGGNGYGLVCVFDALHDMGDPVGAARHIRERLAPDGTWMIVEPMAGESLADNVNPVGRIFYSASPFICTPAALAQGGQALGNQVPEATWRELLAEAGFGRFRRATETPFNRVFEARP
ncbi:class I SAM-dependent methyltransferase [Pseudonocardia sp.]|uniref:class I SAM-dependent methyltransferase n=1 Tax=Pseudonocardia sp. TaxID=60912 RepID=UPI003D0C1B8C